MPVSPLETAGAAIQPTAAAPLHTNEFFTGLWTNASPLGPGPVPYLYQKFYSASRYDRIVDGGNVEISSRLTLMRRPGTSVYNSSLFPPINRFYEWRGFGPNNSETIRIMASCDNPSTGQSGGGTVRDVTGPSTNLVVQNKAANAGRTSFVSVGNHLYWGDGAETGMLVQSDQVWQANTAYNTGDFFVDPNGNLEEAVGTQTANVTNIQVSASGSQWKYVVWLSVPLDLRNNVRLGFNGLTTVPSINGQSIPVQVDSAIQVHWLSSSGSTVAYSSETGTATTGTNNSGPTPPAWNTTPGQITGDGGTYYMQWVNMGPAAMPWGGAAPSTAPTVTQTAAATLYPNWAPNTWYAPSFVIVGGGNLQQLIGPAPPIKTGNSAPAWATTIGAITTEGGGSGSNAQWRCMGTGAWVASNAYQVGDLVLATYTYYVTSTYFDHTVKQWITTTTAITTTNFFRCTAATGVSGATVPNWVNGVGTYTTDGGVTWVNQGTAPGWPGGNQLLSLSAIVLDTNGNLETVQNLGESGAGPTITWQTATGALTTDSSSNSINWLNGGPYSAANSGNWIWAYSGKNSITGQTTTASPLSQPMIVAAGMHPVVQGLGLDNPPWDTIVLWRTAQGGSTLLYDDEFPNPGPGQVWTYLDLNADPASSTAAQPGQLNPLILAPINGQNDPPPASFVPICFYLNRIWGFDGNVLMWSNGPDQGAVMGSGDQGFTGQHRFTLPSLGVMLWETSIGLIVFTNSDTFAVLGQGTYDTNGAPISPFYVVPFQAGIGILSPDAFDVNGSTAYMQLNSRQVISMDPGAGEIEVGFPIGDLLDSNFDPSQTYVTWHQGRSQDTALYVANGSAYWYRMAAVAAPESGNVWSPAAVIAAPGQVKAIKSIETSPGIKALLVGPSVNGNPILMRDLTTNADNGTPYSVIHATISAVTLAQPGTTAAMQYVVTEEKMIDGATPIVVRILFDEIHDFVHIHDGDFRTLRNITADPPNLGRSKSIRIQRLWTSQDPSTVIKCRFYQQDFVWASENYPNELYTNTIYGKLPEKARK